MPQSSFSDSNYRYVNPIALGALHWKFYFVYIATLAAMIPTIYFLFPETKGRTLEEIAMVFDGAKAETEAHRNASIVAESVTGVESLPEKVEYRSMHAEKV